MKIIILGAGKVGAYLTSDLSNEGHDIVVIEKDKEILRHLLVRMMLWGLWEMDEI